MTLDQLLKLKIYCPQQGDNTILAYLNLDFKILLELQGCPILLSGGQRDMINPIHLDVGLNFKAISAKGNDIYWNYHEIKSYTIRRDVFR